MQLLNLFKRSTNGKAGINALYLDHLRFIRFLENTRRVMDTIDDGREKACGEYILDVHYVVAMVEETLSLVGTLVFDACVIRNAGGDALLKRYDDIKTRARRFFSSAQSNRMLEGECDGLDPEYLLLKEALDWFSPEDENRPDSVMGFIADLFNHIMTRTCTVAYPFAEMPFFEMPCRGILHRIHVLPVGDSLPPGGAYTLSDSDCKALRVMLRDISAQTENGTVGVEARWVAVMSGPYVSLAFREGNRILCQADMCLGGDEGGDFLFVFMHERMLPEPLIPDGVRTLSLDDGLLAWSYDRPALELNDTLAQLGTRLFSSPRGLEQILNDPE